MNSNFESLFNDLIGIELVGLREANDGRLLALFKFNTMSDEDKLNLKETINSLTGTMGGGNVYFGNFYGSENVDFFFNIELKKDNLVDKLAYIRDVLLKAIQVAENKISVFSFTIEVDLSIKHAVYSYLSYLPQYLENLGIPVCFQSSMIDKLIKVSILQLNNSGNDELPSAVSTFLFLPSINDFQLSDSNPSINELMEQIERYRQKLLHIGGKGTPIKDACSQIKTGDEPIELFGGYVKISSLEFYGVEINIPRIINKLRQRRN
jgi:hypothetical protein